MARWAVTYTWPVEVESSVEIEANTADEARVKLQEILAFVRDKEAAGGGMTTEDMIVEDLIIGAYEGVRDGEAAALSDGFWEYFTDLNRYRAESDEEDPGHEPNESGFHIG